MRHTFYRLRPPFTGAELSEGYAWDRLSLYSAGMPAGSLVVPRGSGRAVALMFADLDQIAATLSVYGTVLSVMPDVADDETLVSERGKITTSAELQDRANAVGRTADLLRSLISEGELCNR